MSADNNNNNGKKQAPPPPPPPKGVGKSTTSKESLFVPGDDQFEFNIPPEPSELPQGGDNTNNKSADTAAVFSEPPPQGTAAAGDGQLKVAEEKSSSPPKDDSAGAKRASAMKRHKDGKPMELSLASELPFCKDPPLQDDGSQESQGHHLGRGQVLLDFVAANNIKPAVEEEDTPATPESVYDDAPPDISDETGNVVHELKIGFKHYAEKLGKDMDCLETALQAVAKIGVDHEASLKRYAAQRDQAALASQLSAQRDQEAPDKKLDRQRRNKRELADFDKETQSKMEEALNVTKEEKELMEKIAFHKAEISTLEALLGTKKAQKEQEAKDVERSRQNERAELEKTHESKLQKIDKRSATIRNLPQAIFNGNVKKATNKLQKSLEDRFPSVQSIIASIRMHYDQARDCHDPDPYGTGADMSKLVPDGWKVFEKAGAYLDQLKEFDTESNCGNTDEEVTDILTMSKVSPTVSDVDDGKEEVATHETKDLEKVDDGMATNDSEGAGKEAAAESNTATPGETSSKSGKEMATQSTEGPPTTVNATQMETLAQSKVAAKPAVDAPFDKATTKKVATFESPVTTSSLPRREGSKTSPPASIEDVAGNKSDVLTSNAPSGKNSDGSKEVEAGCSKAESAKKAECIENTVKEMEGMTPPSQPFAKYVKAIPAETFERKEPPVKAPTGVEDDSAKPSAKEDISSGKAFAKPGASQSVSENSQPWGAYKFWGSTSPASNLLAPPRSSGFITPKNSTTRVPPTPFTGKASIGTQGGNDSEVDLEKGKSPGSQSVGSEVSFGGFNGGEEDDYDGSELRSGSIISGRFPSFSSEVSTASPMSGQDVSNPVAFSFGNCNSGTIPDFSKGSLEDDVWAKFVTFANENNIPISIEGVTWILFSQSDLEKMLKALAAGKIVENPAFQSYVMSCCEHGYGSFFRMFLASEDWQKKYSSKSAFTLKEMQDDGGPLTTAFSERAFYTKPFLAYCLMLLLSKGNQDGSVEMAEKAYHDYLASANTRASIGRDPSASTTDTPASRTASPSETAEVGATKEPLKDTTSPSSFAEKLVQSPVTATTNKTTESSTPTTSTLKATSTSTENESTPTSSNSDSFTTPKKISGSESINQLFDASPGVRSISSFGGFGGGDDDDDDSLDLENRDHTRQLNRSLSSPSLSVSEASQQRASHSTSTPTSDEMAPNNLGTSPLWHGPGMLRTAGTLRGFDNVVLDLSVGNDKERLEKVAAFARRKGLAGWDKTPTKLSQLEGMKSSDLVLVLDWLNDGGLSRNNNYKQRCADLENNERSRPIFRMALASPAWLKENLSKAKLSFEEMQLEGGPATVVCDDIQVDGSSYTDDYLQLRVALLLCIEVDVDDVSELFDICNKYAAHKELSDLKSKKSWEDIRAAVVLGCCYLWEFPGFHPKKELHNVIQLLGLTVDHSPKILKALRDGGLNENKLFKDHIMDMENSQDGKERLRSHQFLATPAWFSNNHMKPPLTYEYLKKSNCGGPASIVSSRGCNTTPYLQVRLGMLLKLKCDFSPSKLDEIFDDCQKRHTAAAKAKAEKKVRSRPSTNASKDDDDESEASVSGF